jgi:hypothetical protein
MTDLVEWLLAQIAEDEADADTLHDTTVCASVGYDAPPCDCGYPAEVRADLAAKRRIVEEHRTEEACPYHPKTSEYPFGCTTCHRDPECGYVMALGWCDTLRLLALPYAGREGYDERWRPEE